jgi:EAL and modified HD-GYP domain-containing signal transduction protein
VSEVKGAQTALGRRCALDIFVARQPILARNQHTCAYELFFRGGMKNVFPQLEGETATTKLLSDSFFSIGMDKITHGKKAFINFPEALLVKKMPMFFPKESITVEILETVQPTEEVLSSCRELSSAGYELAMDDFIYSDKFIPLLELADLIKFDIRLSSMEEIRSVLTELRKYKKLKFIAEKVETPDEFKQALALGFEYFQGYFFARPQIIEGKQIPPFKLNLLQIVAEANRDDFDFTRLEKHILQDVSISYKLLKYINSAFFRRVNEISSIKQALVLLGEREVKRFVSLMVIAKLAPGKPDELLQSSIIRAKLCELLTKHCKKVFNESEAFTLGLFSHIDAILDEKMDSILKDLPLSTAIKEALTSETGPLGDLIRLTKAYEKGDWEAFQEPSSRIGLDEEAAPGCYMEAVGWAEALVAIQ